MVPKIIGLVDCDSFFVSCETAENPALKGKPVVVTTGDKGCVVSRSKEAKARGVKMGIPVFMDKREHSGIIYIRGNMEKYAACSKRVMNIIKSYSPLVEIASIDEAYIDLSGLEGAFKMPVADIARKMRADILTQTGIPVSIGIAPSKTLAKLAADKAKETDGLMMITPENRQAVLSATPIEQVCGFGKAHTRQIRLAGVATAADFVRLTDGIIQKGMGKNGLDLKYELSGHALSAVDPIPKKPKSIQDTRALENFTSDKNILRAAMNFHLHAVCRRLRTFGGVCLTAGVMLRTKNFAVFADKCRLAQPTNAEEDIAPTVWTLLGGLYNPRVLYRSVGVFLENTDYGAPLQGNLFSLPPRKNSPLGAALDSLEEKFGKNIIKRGF